MSEYNTIASAMSELSDCVDTAERNLSRTRRARRAAWKSPTLTNSWAVFGAAPTYEQIGYALDNDGYVHLKGLLKSGASGTSAFTLPTGYRPVRDTQVAIAASGGLAYVLIGVDGTVKPTNSTNSAVLTYASLSGVSFRLREGDGEVPLGTHDLTYEHYPLTTSQPASARVDLSGMTNLSGVVKWGTAPSTTNNNIFRVRQDLGLHWRNIFYAYVSGATSGLTRVDIVHDICSYISGISPTNYMILNSIKWPSPDLFLTSFSNATYSAGVSNYTTVPTYQTGIRAVKDTMGRCWVGGIVNTTNNTLNSAVAVLPVGYRPTSRIVMTAMGNNAYVPMNIYNDGSITLNAAGTSPMMINHCFWLDNG